MAESYVFFNKGTTSGGRSRGDEDFDEEDVWAAVKERTDLSPKVIKSMDSSSFSTPRGLPTASRMIPRTNNSTNETKVVLQLSAPINMPNWSKIYKKNSKRQGSNGYGCKDSDYGYDDNEEDAVLDDDDDVRNDDEDRVPPHEWIAKKFERSQISAFSVCEGVGRTLKGRDLSKVRNAVLTRTGFLE